MASLNLAAWVECTEVEGPGRRFALWVQGCTIRCPGCCNSHLFPLEPRHLLPAEEVIGWIDRARQSHALEGVTFLGGEPMLQARGLAEVAATCRATGLSVMVFTGFTLERLRRDPLPGTLDLLRHTDLLVDGPYRAEQPESTRHWAGSTNQRFHYLSPRYSPAIETDPAFPHGFELRLHPTGLLQANGWPFAGLSSNSPTAR